VLIVFTARCCVEQELLRQVVRPSACLSSVTLRYRDHIGWNASNVISWLISAGFLLSADPYITDLLQTEHPEILVRGMEKLTFNI